MDNREKLIAILGRMSCDVIGIDSCDTCEHRYEIDCTAHVYADHLIANGVVVREKGEWVYDHWCEFKCSKCGALSKTEPRGEENFCPNCGADMRKGENG